MPRATNNTPPFHRLLSFYSTRSTLPDIETVRLIDSLTGNLALGLDFPVAVAVAIGRHLTLRNTASYFSLDIHIPSVPRTHTPLDGIPIDEKTSYTRTELLETVRRNSHHATSLAGGGGILTATLLQIEALGLWALAADVHTGALSGKDVLAFQRGTLLREIERRREGREQVLPLWRGGPLWVAGHSWAARRVFGVEVYRDEQGERRK